MAQTLYPTFRYRDAKAAIEWLEQALGFERGQVHDEDGRIVHAELSYRGAWIMLGTVGEPADGDPFPRGPSTTYIAVDEVDFAARDPDGNVWSFGTYRVNG